jgi:hypothetical protein
MNEALNPPSLAEAINAKGFTGAAGFRIVTVRPGYAEVALPRRDGADTALHNGYNMNILFRIFTL